MRKIIIFSVVMAAFHTLIAEDYNERRYHYEILNPKSEEKPFPKGFLEERVKENLGRSFTAVPTDNGGVYLCWRVLDTDNPNVKFNIYRVYNGKKVKLNRKNITDISGFTDEKPINGEDVTYILEEENNKKKFSHELNVNTGSLVNYTSIKLKDGETARKIAVADLNGDGKYDYIIRTPDINIDPGMPGNMDGTTLKISAYLNDGTYLWTKDLGQGIEPGIWYSPFIAYDFDGDGKAEVALKTAPKDAQRDEKGRIASGDEYLTVLNGMTGEEIATVDWPERNYRYGNLNRQNRNQIGMAYLDGKTPYILAARGTYKLMVVDAWMLHEGKLIKAWRWDGDEENPVVRSQGAHNMVTGDVDDDGCDEILLGSCMLNNNGTLLWSTGIGHSDKSYMTDIDPNRQGMEVFLVSEPKKTDGRGVIVCDARTGKTLWSIGDSTWHVGDGMVADIDPDIPGLECFASEDPKGGSNAKYMFSASGERITDKEIPGCRNWIWWDEDLLRETFVQSKNERHPTENRRRHSMRIAKYGKDKYYDNIEGSILMIADLEGDWREEVITALPGEIRIYKTGIPARDKRITLMQDPVYRSYVLQRSQGYEQAPVPGYYLGE